METRDTSSQQAAEYAMALDLSSQLTLVLDEEMVLGRILEIFTILFAPQRIIFYVIAEGAVKKTLVFPASLKEFPLADLNADLPEITPAGFCLRIPYKEETIGIIDVDGLAFPAHRERYLSLALSIVGVCGLSLINARTHRRLETALSDLRQENARSLRLSDELRVTNEQLEERVRERTKELENTALHLAEEVAQRRAAEETVRCQLDEKTILLRELHHRVKNNLQIIMSLLSLQAHKMPDPAFHLALMESQNRIRIISAVHEMLLTSPDLARIDLHTVVSKIAANLLSLYQVKPETIALSIDIPDIVVDINTAIPLGLVLNELVSNSLKHAFPGGRPGGIFITIRDNDAALVITCRDDGVGMTPGSDWENPDTVGFILINGLTGQLGGTIEKEPGAGTCFCIRVQKVPGTSKKVRGTFNDLP